MTRPSQPAQVSFIGAANNKLVADVFGHRGQPVLLLHGGGQTRHAWRKTAEEIARTGRVAYALDQRGHGDSDWVESGAYGFADFAADVKIVAAELARRSGGKPVAIGASLGGIASLLAEGELNRSEPLFDALVLVDITPRVSADGVGKIHSFMRAHALKGFSSVAEAAQGVAEERRELGGEDLAGGDVVAVGEAARDGQDLIAIEQRRSLAEAVDVDALSAGPDLLEGELHFLITVGARGPQDQDGGIGHKNRQIMGKCA